ncbi:BREX-1 system phosphatase PglZ type B [Cellulomonas sp. PSBB021]|uniref:BREX-1 system phosphatase PglZ type B n=1 Tax=Cellulomonas sp. PSBB021 TaxID=2003551 RepID=UPI000B8D68ED|nr:BREX-1 system phosphatase PglZ type B [Cellulomonas sp. PSBB021]ASR55532.1 hypothetical protein CBP52_11020 [Cellulomonas sp. PSBB021]
MTTVRAEIGAALRALASRFDESSQVAPAAVLWADPERVWERVMGRVQESVPVLVLAESHEAGTAAGPAIWIRAVLATAEDAPAGAADAVVGLPDTLAARGEGNPWVVYLPGVSPGDVVGDGPASSELAPLVELAHRSRWWLQSNQQPWTPQAFLRSQDGLRLKVAQDGATRQAITDVLDVLLDQDVERLREHTVDASRLLSLVVPDDVRELLAWMNDPDAARARMQAAGTWTALVGTVRSAYGLDLAKDTVITAAGALGRRDGRWALAWQRYAETAAQYPAIPDLLDKARPADLLFGGADPHPDSWPSADAEREDALRVALAQVANRGTRDEAAARLVALDDEHVGRRGNVWHRLGRAPLLDALGALAQVARTTAEPLPHGAVAAWAQWYSEGAFRADDAALRALAAASSGADRDAVVRALGAVYDPWVDLVAGRFQEAALSSGYDGSVGVEAAQGTCVLFVDALRLDAAHRLADVLTARGSTPTSTTRLAAFPSVTPTGQPAVAPLDERPGPGPDFAAGDAQGRALKGDVLKQALAAGGVQYLGAGETGDPAGRAWTQTTAIDVIGHAQHHALASYLDAELAKVADRIESLLAAGWRRVLVVTDHGWLLPARPARKVELPQHLTHGEAARKPRAARLKAGQDVDVPTLPWTHDPTVRFASPPGSAAFQAGVLYEHGGLSPQECVTPVLTVEAGGGPTSVEAHIEAVKWTNARCRVDVVPPGDGLVVEVRLTPGDSSTCVAGPAAVRDGEAKALVQDDEALGRPAFVVLLSADRVVDQRRTTVGGDA